MLPVEKTLILCGGQGFSSEYIPVFLAGKAVKDFKNPVIDFECNNTHIQSEGINQNFGVYASPDELLKEHHQELSSIKLFMYRILGRHLMNRNVKRLGDTRLYDNGRQL